MVAFGSNAGFTGGRLVNPIVAAATVSTASKITAWRMSFSPIIRSCARDMVRVAMDLQSLVNASGICSELPGPGSQTGKNYRRATA